ncbi:MAG: hypothetical protein ACTHNU_01735 [Gaiellales bacterium]
MRRLPALLLALAASAACLPAAAQAGSSSVATLDAQIHSTSAQVTSLQAELAVLSSRLTRAEDRVARLESRVRWTDRSLARAQPVTLGLRAAVLRRDAQHRRLSSAESALRAVEADAAAHPVLPLLVGAEQQLQRLTAARRRALTALATPIPPAAAGGNQTVSRGAWAVSLLDALGAPRCQSNLTAVVSWETAENTGAAWNPLATTLTAPGSGRYNHAGVRDFPSQAEGIAATVDTLRLGYYDHGYGWIVYRLSQCAPSIVTVRAVNASDWCAGCAGGSYVTSMLPVVEADYTDHALLPVTPAER